MPATALVLLSAGASAAPPGLDAAARQELSEAGVDQYLGTSVAAASGFGVWTRHTFDPRYTPDPSYPSGARPDGPVCIQHSGGLLRDRLRPHQSLLRPGRRDAQGDVWVDVVED